jgi:hypothetical protein
MPHRERVILHIYDLAEAGALNETLVDVGLGLYHSGVEVHGVEWTFAAGAGSGIVSHTPGQPGGGHVLRDSRCLGATALSARDVDALVARLRPQWPGSRYHILRCKCVAASASLRRVLASPRLASLHLASPTRPPLFWRARLPLVSAAATPFRTH